jgi:methylmalonyl-CoA mutase
VGDEFVYRVRDREIRVPLYTESLCRQRIPKVVVPRFQDPGRSTAGSGKRTCPGSFPYTAGVFPFKREGRGPHPHVRRRRRPGAHQPAVQAYLSEHAEAKRLSTAFDSVTLYGWDPDERPDIYGKVGNSGVSVCTLDDVKVLYGGFDLCCPPHRFP